MLVEAMVILQLQGGVAVTEAVMPDWMVGAWHRETVAGQMDRRDRVLMRVMKTPQRTVTEQRKTWTIFMLDEIEVLPGPVVELRSRWRSWTVDKRTRRVVSRHSGEQVERCRPGPGVDEMTVEAEAVIDGEVSRWRSVDHKRESASSALDP